MLCPLRSERQRVAVRFDAIRVSDTNVIQLNYNSTPSTLPGSPHHGSQRIGASPHRSRA